MDKETLRLQTPIQFWYQHQPNKDNFSESLLPVGLANTVEEFWHFYQHFKRPHALDDNSYLYAFRHDCKPVWEDPLNQNGGSFLLRFEKEHSSKVWEDILLGFVVRSLKDPAGVNGLRLKVRKNVLTVEVWVSDSNDEEKLEKLRDWILKCVCLNPDTPIELLKFHPE